MQNLKKYKKQWFRNIKKMQNTESTKDAGSETSKNAKHTILEKCIFCWFPGGPQRYPTLSVLSPNHGKIAKPRKMHFLWFQKHKKMMKSQKKLFWEMPKNDFSWVSLKITTFCRETVTGLNGHPNP